MKVFSYVVTLSHDKDLAEEITQETFYRALTAHNAFRGDSKELTYLCAIAKNLFNDEKRRHSHSSRSVSIEDIPSNNTELSERMVIKENSYRIHVILHSLEDPYKEVFELRCFGELSFKQIGKIFGKTENWARITYYRARLKIIERMDSK